MAVDPQSWNLYSYVSNNPPRYTDPDGRGKNVCSVGSDGKEACMWVGEFDGQCEMQNGRSVCWNKAKSEWGEPPTQAQQIWKNVQWGVSYTLEQVYGNQLGAFLDASSRNDLQGAIALGSLLLPGRGVSRGALSNTRTRLLQQAQSPKLKSIIKELYRPGAAIGDGGTAAAIRYTKQTGQLVKGTDHALKGMQRRQELTKLYHNPSTSPQDRRIIRDLLIDLQGRCRVIKYDFDYSRSAWCRSSGLHARTSSAVARKDRS